MDIKPIVFDYFVKDHWIILLKYLNPQEWYNLALTSKILWVKMKFVLDGYRKRFEMVFLKLNTPNKKELCLRPLMKGLKKGFGCDGPIKNNICMYHKTAKLPCVKCKKEPVSGLCKGPYCDGKDCRDYIWVYHNGKSYTTLRFVCITNHCTNFSDKADSHCEKCAKLLYTQAIDPVKNPSVRCTARTNRGKGICQNFTNSWSQKCGIHIKKHTVPKNQMQNN
jgi:hypothetical protein